MGCVLSILNISVILQISLLFHEIFYKDLVMWACLLSQVITPLLLFSVGIDSRLSNVVLDEWALDGACLSITPTTATSESGADNTTEVFITIICHHGDDKSVISSPRIYPGIVYHSVLLSCCQLVMSLCGRPPAKQVAKAVVPVINCGMDHVMFAWIM